MKRYLIGCMAAVLWSQTGSAQAVDGFLHGGGIGRELALLQQMDTSRSNFLMAKAVPFYKKAAVQGDALAAVKLALLAWDLETKVANHEINTSQKPEPLYFFQLARDGEPVEVATIGSTLAGVYLISQKAYPEALPWLYDGADRGHIAAAEIYAAFVLRALGDEGNANRFLNRACTNPGRGQKIREFCQGEGVERLDLTPGDRGGEDASGTTGPVTR